MKKLLFPMLLILFITNSACSSTTNTDDEIRSSATKTDNSLEGPIQKPTSGYGSDGSYEVAEIDFDNPQYAGTQVSVFYPQGTTSPRPTIFFRIHTAEKIKPIIWDCIVLLPKKVL
uniref:Secreted protein n=1 Tax=Chryseobacterium endophyticum TaxID=1854762 RepID=A0AAU6WNJ5_9FLAO